MSNLRDQLKKRRIALGLKQGDMLLRIGVSRQQYQQVESKGNPRLDTLELIARGLNSELMLVPREKLNAVLAILSASDERSYAGIGDYRAGVRENEPLSDNPWKALLEDSE
jgi:transcriptional regulator with XRE-family HTH domain